MKSAMRFFLLRRDRSELISKGMGATRRPETASGQSVDGWHAARFLSIVPTCGSFPFPSFFPSVVVNANRVAASAGSKFGLFPS
jgi:hypothetical protein